MYGYSITTYFCEWNSIRDDRNLMHLYFRKSSNVNDLNACSFDTVVIVLYIAIVIVEYMQN